MRLLVIIVAVFMYACTTSTAGDTKKESGINNQPAKKVLLELFTSQGCSSCPPADKLVSRLSQLDTNLVVVSFHVDYWDRLGWKDVFSDHNYTLRQQRYAQTLHIQSVYTPQAVVQGQFEMVGSNQPGILHAVETARLQSDSINAEIESSVINQSITVHYHVTKQVLSGLQINVVLVQNRSSTSVKRGENGGSQLEGYHVARSIKSIIPDKNDGVVELTLPDDVKPNNASVVVFIQNVSSGKITAVRQISL